MVVLSVPCSRVACPLVDTHVGEGWPSTKNGLSIGSRQTFAGDVEVNEDSGTSGARVRMEGRDFPGSPVVKTALPTQRAWVQSLVGELRSHRSEERRVGKECRSRWSPYH